MTMYQFDEVPLAARGIARGQEILRGIHEKRPDLPCFLVSSGVSFGGKPSLGEELLLGCVQSGGARGVIEADFSSQTARGWEDDRDALAAKIREIAGKVHLEKSAYEMGKEQKALSFDAVPAVDKDGTIRIRLRNLRLARALAAADVSEVLQDVERPNIRFGDVYGADAAKGELQFVVDWLADPVKFKALGIRTPRGILLYGHPGTGKTMLARALAGECNAAFLVASAANFITKWVGSGPESVRNLFFRARKYAPAIVFIDEIDAIGKKRTGSEGSGPREETLNAVLTEMDGFGTPAARPVIVLQLTNLIEHLDDSASQEVRQGHRSGQAGSSSQSSIPPETLARHRFPMCERHCHRPGRGAIGKHDHSRTGAHSRARWQDGGDAGEQDHRRSPR